MSIDHPQEMLEAAIDAYIAQELGDGHEIDSDLYQNILADYAGESTGHIGQAYVDAWKETQP